MNQMDMILRQAAMLIERLEKLSADSIWAHRASGIRGSILRSMKENKIYNNRATDFQLEQLIHQGFEILQLAAKEIPDQNQVEL